MKNTSRLESSKIKSKSVEENSVNKKITNKVVKKSDKSKSNKPPVKICIVDGSKLSRIAFRYSLAEFEYIDVVEVFDTAESCIEFLDRSYINNCIKNNSANANSNNSNGNNVDGNNVDGNNVDGNNGISINNGIKGAINANVNYDYHIDYSSYSINSEINNGRVGNVDSINNTIEIEDTVNVILINIDLPIINGIEAIEIIKDRYPSIKIIALSDTDKVNEVPKAIAAGINGYALKDIDFEELSHVIQTVNRGAVWFDAKVANYTIGKLKNRLPKEKEKRSIEKLLTDREKEVLKLMANGLSNPEISKKLYISPYTSKAHVSNIFSKMEVKDRVQAVLKAYELDLL